MYSNPSLTQPRAPFPVASLSVSVNVTAQLFKSVGSRAQAQARSRRAGVVLLKYKITALSLRTGSDDQVRMSFITACCWSA